jgi:hypothetical protein
VKLNVRDLGAGIFFFSVGLFYFGYTLQKLSIGRALQMGPGYFPIVLSSIMTFIGLVILIKSFFAVPNLSFGKIPWRAIFMISASIIFFGYFLRELGLFPTVLCTSLLACLSSDQIKLTSALMVSTVMAVFCTLVFAYGVKLTIPVFGSWIM